MQGEVIPKILKPKGTGGRDFNIRKHMGLDPKDEGDKATYKDVMRSIKLWSNKKLDICQSLRHQESQMITLVELKSKCYVIRQYLKNSSEQYRAATKQRGQLLQNQEEAEVEIAPDTHCPQTAAKSRAVQTQPRSPPCRPALLPVPRGYHQISLTCEVNNCCRQVLDSSCQMVIAAKTPLPDEMVAPAKASAAKSKLTAKSTVAPKPQAIVKPTTEPKLSITPRPTVYKEANDEGFGEVPAEAKSTLVKKKAKPTPLFDASSNQDLANPALEMLGFDSAGPKSKVVKGKKKKTSKAENLVIQDITGSNENSNKRKRPVADVENLDLPASLFIVILIHTLISAASVIGLQQAKRAKLAVKGTSQTTLAAKLIIISLRRQLYRRCRR
ncbi:hypothetical protein JB92DRAFT_3077808 [Gautieria morchelliformis]|nr:hypothetical protein JB92DRAFT_3077808 [Gautieria morchelliformis]